MTILCARYLKKQNNKSKKQFTQLVWALFKREDKKKRIFILVLKKYINNGSRTCVLFSLVDLVSVLNGCWICSCIFYFFVWFLILILWVRAEQKKQVALDVVAKGIVLWYGWFDSYSLLYPSLLFFFLFSCQMKNKQKPSFIFQSKKWDYHTSLCIFFFK